MLLPQTEGHFCAAGSRVTRDLCCLNAKHSVKIFWRSSFWSPVCCSYSSMLLVLFVTTYNIYKPRNSRVSNISLLSFTAEYKLLLHNAVVLQVIVTEVSALNCASLPATTRPSAVWMYCAPQIVPQTVGRSVAVVSMLSCFHYALWLYGVNRFLSVRSLELAASFLQNIVLYGSASHGTAVCLLFAAFNCPCTYKHTNNKLLWTVTLLTYVVISAKSFNHYCYLLLDKHISTLLFASSSVRN
jgi:hypothetical protein